MLGRAFQDLSCTLPVFKPKFCIIGQARRYGLDGACCRPWVRYYIKYLLIKGTINFSFSFKKI